jgi:beta-lactamase class A
VFAVALLVAHHLQASNVQAELARIAKSIPGRAGAAVMLVETGERFSVRGTERFPMQSVYKAPIATAVLHEVDSGRLSLDRPVRILASEMPRVHSPIRERSPGGATLTVKDLLRAAIVDSDGTASDALLRLVPPAQVNRFLRSISVTGMSVATTEREMSRDPMAQYRSWATPDGAAAFLAALQRGTGLSARSRARLLQWMGETATFPGRIKGQLPPGTSVAHKTGTDRTVKGLTRATNDIGIITLPDGRHVAVAVFLADSRASEAEREDVIARIARAAWDHWVRARPD